jgi:hypothetical protein
LGKADYFHNNFRFRAKSEAGSESNTIFESGYALAHNFGYERIQVRLHKIGRSGKGEKKKKQISRKKQML